jgi:predicted dehydrogenase
VTDSTARGGAAPVRTAIVGLGRIYDLNVLAYRDNADADIVAIVDPDPVRREARGVEWPAAAAFESVEAMIASGVELDAVEVLVPIVQHADVAVELLGRGWHVNLQKPMCRDLDEARRMTQAATETGAALRVMDNYLFYEPLVRLKQLVDEGAIGPVAGYHLKMVASGRGGWEVPFESYVRQFELADQGRGILLFDDGWHKLSTALWLFGPVREVRAWIGATELVPGCVVDAPTTVLLEHESGVRGVWDLTVAVDMYLRSNYYTNDERWEVTGRAGFARVNRCTSLGLQQPSLEVYRDGELRTFHALDDDWASSFRDSGLHWLKWLTTRSGPLLWDADEATQVLRIALAAYESDARGGLGVAPLDLR